MSAVENAGAGLSRRSFLAGIAALAVGGASAALLSACGGTQAASTGAAGGDSAAGAAGGAGDKTLVAYFSGTGHTKKVAETLADSLGADLFVIEPADAYSDEDLDYTDDGSRVVKEHDDENTRDYSLVKGAPDNWDEYGTVLVGYPIWWQDAAWAMWGFATTNDFTGKTVIPFCTSYSSGIGESGDNLAKRAGTGDWQEGRRFEEDAGESDVEDWAKSLDI